jgi:hypothetical protein
MIRSGRCVGIASDVTSSGLADDSVDMVINAHTIEHLFWPDLFADEIKRISKIGATFVVIFAAGPETEPDGGHEFVERIRHYFTPAEIQAWASQIGPGTLMDVEGESGELAYRVYVGTVRNQSRSPRYPPAIPLSAFRFRFPNRRYGRIRVHMARTSG